MKFVRAIGILKNIYVKDNKYDHVIINLDISKKNIIKYDFISEQDTGTISSDNVSQSDRLSRRLRSDAQQLYSSLHIVDDIYDNNCEIDINIGSLQYLNEYAIIHEQIDNFNYPNGIIEAQLNYKTNFNLKNNNFTKIHEKDLADLIINYVRKSEKIIVYGTKYVDYPHKLGIHDIHMDSLHDNNNHDGAIAFYLSKPNPHLEWLFIKFENQYL